MGRLRIRQAVVTVLSVALLGAGLGACGGGGGPKAKGGLALKSGGAPPQLNSAGSSDDYKPTGRLVADTGFRPGVNGFSFENYGGALGQVDLDVTAMVELFGPGVCLPSLTKTTCQLSPQAQQYADQVNKAMSGGHCYGFSVSALRFYRHVLSPTKYGAPTPPNLVLKGNVPLQRFIAQAWFTQMYDTVSRERIAGTPNQLLDNLIRVLNERKDAYTLSFFKKHPPYDGHAITPYAVEDKGGGHFAVLVYDNNYPLVTRAFNFDRNTNTWNYNGSPNPNDAAAEYRGGKDNSIAGGQQPQINLEPMAPGLTRLTCPFCGSSGPAGAGGSVAGAYSQVALEGNPSNHAHLVLTDDRGRRTGIVGGRLLRQIPGSRVLVPSGNQDWRTGAEPLYRVPAGTKVTVTLDAAALKRPTTESVSLVAPGATAAVNRMQVSPGEQHRVAFGAAGTGLSYTPPSGQTEQPVITFGTQVGGQAYTASVGVQQVKGGSTLQFGLDPRTRKLQVKTPTAPGTGTAYGVTVTRETAHGRQASSQANVALGVAKQATVNLGALRRKGQRLPLSVRKR
jgi:hypothetical protein